MVDESQRQEIGTPPPAVELVPELADSDLMASCELRKTIRTELDAIVRLYDKRYAKHRDDFLEQRRGNKPLSKSEISRFHRQWREYVRGVVEPLFTRARRAARLQAFVRDQEQELGCKLVDGPEAKKIVPFLNLKLLAQKGRLRQVQFEKTEFFHAEEDLKRIAVTDADIIEKKRQRYEANERKKAREREERILKNRLFCLLYNQGIERHVIDRLKEEVLSFKSVRDLLGTDHFTRPCLTFPEDCATYLEKEILSAQIATEDAIALPQPNQMRVPE